VDTSRSSVELLSYFDSPFRDEDCKLRFRPSVGVKCVLKWAAALAVLNYGACNLLQAGYCLAAERVLLDAVRAGALEATLPQSTRATVTETVERHLNQQSIAMAYATVTIRQNGMPVGRAAHFAEGSVVSVSVAIRAADVLPIWLSSITSHGSDSRLQASVERRVPGKHLPVAADL
jgi:hypothetical protein